MRTATAWRKGLIGFAFAPTLLVGIGWITFGRLADLRAATSLVQHSLLVQAEAERIPSLRKDAETGQRDVVITVRCSRGARRSV